MVFPLFYSSSSKIVKKKVVDSDGNFYTTNTVTTFPNSLAGVFDTRRKAIGRIREAYQIYNRAEDPVSVTRIDMKHIPNAYVYKATGKGKKASTIIFAIGEYKLNKISEYLFYSNK
jgi:hypothetical protein